MIGPILLLFIFLIYLISSIPFYLLWNFVISNILDVSKITLIQSIIISMILSFYYGILRFIWNKLKEKDD